MAAAEVAWRAAGNNTKLGQLLDQRAHFARLRREGESGIDLAQQALRYLPDEDRFDRASSLLALAEGYVLLGDLATVNRYAQQAGALCRQSLVFAQPVCVEQRRTYANLSPASEM